MRVLFSVAEEGNVAELSAILDKNPLYSMNMILRMSIPH
jgi:hypothetical protein